MLIKLSHGGGGGVGGGKGSGSGKGTKADGAAPRRLTFNDFGCGVGQLGHALLARDPGFLWRGYDGAGLCS